MLDRSTNIQTEVAIGAPVTLATARQRIPDILAVAVVLFFAVATVAVDATEGMKYVYNTTVPVGTVVSVFCGTKKTTHACRRMRMLKFDPRDRTLLTLLSAH